MIQQFELIDIQRSKVGDDAFAAVTLFPVVVPSATPGVPLFSGAVNYPATIRHTGIPASLVADWNLGDLIDVAFTKAGA